MSEDSNIEGALMIAAKEFLTEGISPVYAVETAIAWENVKSSAVDFENWSSFFYRPNAPIGATVGRDGIDTQTGFIQIDFNVPTDSGISYLRTWEDKARIFFAAGNNFEHRGYHVTITETGMGQGRIVDNHFRRSLTVNFRAQLKRQNTT